MFGRKKKPEPSPFSPYNCEHDWELNYESSYYKVFDINDRRPKKLYIFKCKKCDEECRFEVDNKHINVQSILHSDKWGKDETLRCKHMWALYEDLILVTCLSDGSPSYEKKKVYKCVHCDKEREYYKGQAPIPRYIETYDEIMNGQKHKGENMTKKTLIEKLEIEREDYRTKIANIEAALYGNKNISDFQKALLKVQKKQLEGLVRTIDYRIEDLESN